MDVTPSPSGQNLKASVTLALITCTLLATLPALTFPKVEKLFNAANPQIYPWQLLTASFAHGWAFLPPLTHLAANLVLFFFTGPWTERLLGSARYLLMLLVTLLAAGLARFLPGAGPAGASAFILACGPVLLCRWMSVRNDETYPLLRKLWLGLLVLGLMLGTPLVYGAWLARQSSTPWLALLEANAVHLTAFLVGGLAAHMWRERLVLPAPDSFQPGGMDRLAAAASALLPAGMAILILLGALKKI